MAVHPAQKAMVKARIYRAITKKLYLKEKIQNSINFLEDVYLKFKDDGSDISDFNFILCKFHLDIIRNHILFFKDKQDKLKGRPSKCEMCNCRLDSEGFCYGCDYEIIETEEGSRLRRSPDGRISPERVELVLSRNFKLPWKHAKHHK